MKSPGGMMEVQENTETPLIKTTIMKQMAQARSETPQTEKTIIETENVDFYYGAAHALKSINIEIPEKKATAFIGPSGCGKTTLLRCLNRMNDLIDGTRVARGTIKIHGVEIYQRDVDVIELRKRVGMVFQKSNPFPKSIYENITYGLRLQGLRDKSRLDEI